MRRLGGCHARAALPSGSRSVGLGSSADGFWPERKAAESATLIQVSHPQRLPSESIRKRIDRLVLGHPDWTACCEDRRVRWASCKREVRDRGASPPSCALRGLEPTRMLSAAERGTPLTRYVQARVPKCDIRPSSERRHGSRVLEPAIGDVRICAQAACCTDGDASRTTFGPCHRRRSRGMRLAVSDRGPCRHQAPDLDNSGRRCRTRRISCGSGGARVSGGDGCRHRRRIGRGARCCHPR